MKRSILIIAIVGAAWTLRADQRYYVWTYQPHIEVPGEHEFEYYLTAKAPDTSDWETMSWEHQVEFEMGLTDHWDLGIYQVFTDKNGSFHYKGFKIKTRYMPWERNEKPVDFVLYLEYGRDRDFEAPNKAEMKLIIGRETKRFDWALNYTGEAKFAPGSGEEHKLQWGMSTPVAGSVRMGMEAFVVREDGETFGYAGPSVAFGSDGFWITLNVSAGLNDKSDDYRARMIMGFPLY